MSSDDSCIVRGSSISNHCKMQAAYLCKLIYKRPAGANGFETNWPEEIKKAEANWDEWKDFNRQEESGFVARLYKPKGYKADGKNDEALCWPTLVFRGTDFDDFRGLAYHVSIQAEGLQKTIDTIIRNVDEDTFHVFSPLTKKGNNIFPVELTGILDAELSRQYQNPTKEEIIAAGFTIRDDLSVQVEVDLKEPLSGRAKIEANVLIHEGRTGDWANNLLQGVGDIENSPAYKAAFRTARIVMEEYILKTHDRRLTITGHSLGGGLATAADFTARFFNIGNNAQIYSLVFNPAGLHENTYAAIEREAMKNLAPEQLQIVHRQKIAEAEAASNAEQAAIAGNGRPACEQKPNSSDAVVDVFRVEDEILTTFAYTPQHMPFLQGVMNLLQQGLPQPVGNKISMPPLSPGRTQSQENLAFINPMAVAEHGQPVSSGDGDYVPPRQKLAPLPNLFPLAGQTAIPGQAFPHLAALSEIFTRYSRTMRYSADEVSNCVTEMFTYLDEKFFSGQLRNYMNSSKDRRILPVFSGGLKVYFGSISTEKAHFVKILDMSSNYHGMDYVIASYEGYLKNKKKENNVYYNPAEITVPEDAIPNMVNTLIHL